MVAGTKYHHGRNVTFNLYSPENDDTPPCSDCGYPSQAWVVEENGDIWYWCGSCDIGG